MLAGLVQAQPATGPGAGASAVTELLLQRVEGALELTAQVEFELSQPVEDALRKGIPMFFVAEAEIVRERWYWTDRRVAHAARHMRLAFQPLTQRWRLTVGTQPIDSVGSGLTLSQSFDDLGEALASMRRFARWHVADAAQVPADREHVLRFRFALDVSQLPRPLQIGAVGQSDWDIAASASIALPAQGAAR